VSLDAVLNVFKKTNLPFERMSEVMLMFRDQGLASASSSAHDYLLPEGVSLNVYLGSEA